MEPSNFDDPITPSATDISLTESRNQRDVADRRPPEALQSDRLDGARMARKQLKIVRLLEPELCLECRFAQTADVENEQGTHQKMIYCRRLDCDNWDIVNAEPARSMELDDWGLDAA